MPEGDTLHRAAIRVGVITGQRIGRVGGSHRDVVAHGRRLQGATVAEVRARGKHLIVAADNGWAARTHLGMTGTWQIYRPGEKWRTTPGKARLVIETSEWIAVCFAAPTVQIAPIDRVDAAIAHLGPDLIHDLVDWDDVVARARASTATTVADLLLDQGVMAGIGNVYKSETLHLERLHPELPPATLPDEALIGCGERARRLLIANRERAIRSTTGRRQPGQELWVYGRAGRPCRRCGSQIAMSGGRSDERLTFWCPRCQPPAIQPSAGSRSVENE